MDFREWIRCVRSDEISFETLIIKKKSNKVVCKYAGFAPFHQMRCCGKKGFCSQTDAYATRGDSVVAPSRAKKL